MHLSDSVVSSLELKGQERFGRGASEQQRLDLSRTSTLLGMDANRLSAANQAMMQNQQMIAGGIGQAVGGLTTGFAAGGGFSKDGFKMETFLGQ